jgi:hypothetical protein
VSDTTASQLRTLDRASRSRLDALMTSSLRVFSRFAASVVLRNPSYNVDTLFQRPDVLRSLEHALGMSRERALRQVSWAWAHLGGPPGSGYLEALLSDVMEAFDQEQRELPGRLTRAAQQVARVSSDHPRVDTARARADAVSAEADRLASRLSMRSGMAVSSAITRAPAQALLDADEQRGPGWRKMWVADFSGRNVPCATCQWLHGTVVDAPFPHGGPPGARSAPVFEDLMGPGRHPYCHCRLQLVPPVRGRPADEAPPTVKAPRPVYIRSSDVRAMPKPRYDLLVAFLRRSLNRLGAVVERLAGEFKRH